MIIYLKSYGLEVKFVKKTNPKDFVKKDFSRKIPNLKTEEILLDIPFNNLLVYNFMTGKYHFANSF